MKKIEVNKEKLMSALFLIGFNQVDPLLFNNTLERMLGDNEIFEFKEKELTKKFMYFTEYDGIIFKLKSSYDLETQMIVEKNNWLLEKALYIDSEIFYYLECLDFGEITFQKIMQVGYNPNHLRYLLSDKEKEILCNVLGMGKVLEKSVSHNDNTNINNYNKN